MFCYTVLEVGRVFCYTMLEVGQGVLLHHVRGRAGCSVTPC